MLKDFFSLAFQNLKHRGVRSWLTMLGIFIGIAAVVSLISLGAGLQNAVMGQFGGMALDRLTIQNKGTGFGPPGSIVVEKLTEEDVELLENVNGVDLVVPRLIRVVEVEFNGISGFTYATDIPTEDDAREFVYESFEMEAAQGRLLRQDDTGKIVVGSDIAESERFGKEIRVGSDITINEKKFEVVGILEKSQSFQLNGVYFLMREDLEEILEIDGEYDLIVAQVQDMDEIEEVGRRIEQRLRAERNEDPGEESFTVETPEQALDSVNTILDVINLVVTGIAAISLIVGGVGIANTMYTSVVKRTKEIGIMKAIGAKNEDILWIFMIEAGLLGLVGGVVGALMGLGFAFLVSNVANQALGQNLFTITVDYALFFGAIAFAFLIGIVSGILPALQASRLNVVEAIRK